MSPVTTPDAPDVHEAAEPLVLVRREGAITRLTLNRPRALNAVNAEMFRLLRDALDVAQGDGSRAVLIDGAGERGLCGGGDIKELAAADPREILALEYQLDYAISVSAVPVVVIMDGITMGGGIGLGGHAAHRIVTERSRLALPEVRIGAVPDVGGHLLLARIPGRLGEYLAVTAAEMSGADAIAFGFADALVRSTDLAGLRQALAAGASPASVCARFATAVPEAPLREVADWWTPVAEAALGSGTVTDDPVGAAARLLTALERTEGEAASATAAAIRSACPTSVAVTLAQLERTRTHRLDLAGVLADDLRVFGRMGARPDFAEGVRAQVIDKDRTPRWSPAHIADLDPEAIARLLDPRPIAGELTLTL